MCLLAYCDHDATPDYEGLWTASVNNPDGFGWALHLGSRIITGHSMDASVAIETYQEALDKYPGSASMYHARYATHGTTDLANCHPFTVGEGKGTVLAHNGIIPHAPREKDRSDTRWFAEVELPRRGLQILDKPNKWNKLERWLSSKVVLFTTEESLKYEIYILNEHDGDWVDGVWWSNDSYKHIYSWGTTGYGLSAHSFIPREGDEEALPEMCPHCMSVLTHDEAAVFGYCLTCEICLDCGEDFGLCLCYQAKQTTLDYGVGGWDDEDFATATEIALAAVKNK